MEKQFGIIIKASCEFIKLGVKHDSLCSRIITTPLAYFLSSFDSAFLIRYIELGSMFIIGNITCLHMVELFSDNKYETIEITEILSVIAETPLVPVKINPKLKDAKTDLALVPIKPVMKHKATYMDPNELAKLSFEVKKPDIKKPPVEIEVKKPPFEAKKPAV